MKGAFVGFLVMLALGAGGSTAARMTILDHSGARDHRPAIVSQRDGRDIDTSAQAPYLDSLVYSDGQP